MHLTHDYEFDIATGKSRRELNWKNRSILWSKFVERISVTQRTHETYLEYIAAKQERQGEIKDVGAFLGGFLANGKRSRTSVVYRQLVTLDIDHAAPGIWVDFTMLYGNAACCYSTHKHCPEKPRLRLILPLDREVAPDEYQAIARRIAGEIGIEVFDHTTFEPSRLMYWPSTSKDGVYEFNYQDGPWISADDTLAGYHNWKDSSEWPVSERFNTIIQKGIAKQGDPLEKTGVIGAFCRTYTIEEAIDKFLGDVYSPCDVEGRYTYIHGSTTGGLVVYDSKFTYSHHGTDPTSMKLCNAFDLVRIHRYGLKDEDSRSDTPANKLPSYLAMVGFATEDTAVRRTLGTERYAAASEDFAEGLPEEAQGHEEIPEPANPDWLEELEYDSKANLLRTTPNARLIFENDAELRGSLTWDTFRMTAAVTRRLPGIPKDDIIGRQMCDTDLSFIKDYYQSLYKFPISKEMLKDVTNMVFRKNQANMLMKYVEATKWDGVSRMETLLIDFLGAEDTTYTRQVTRKTLIAAIARIYQPGCKFDEMLVLVGPQGVGKSTLVAKLGGDYYCSSLTVTHMVKGKDAAEIMRGHWLLEVQEMAGMRKAEHDAVKAYVSTQTDVYRVPFDTITQSFPRKCIFIGTTNDPAFLTDPSGNRRYWPVSTSHTEATLNVWEDFTEDYRAQLWAEALHYYKAKEPLHLTKKVTSLAKQQQMKHTMLDERTGSVEIYLSKLLPEEWESLGIHERRAWLQGDELQADGVIQRTYVSALEIYCEVFAGRKDIVKPSDLTAIHNVMRNMADWQRVDNLVTVPGYGRQRVYRFTGETRMRVGVTGLFNEFNEEI